jgi:signal transduction histidine kinase
VIANTALPSLFENLIQNALVHGKATRVELKVTPRQTMCEIQVRDNGSGIPERIQPRIFDEGFHFGKTGQSGLGLYISRKLVERYGGTISVVDNQPTGAVLIVELVRQM